MKTLLVFLVMSMISIKAFAEMNPKDYIFAVTETNGELYVYVNVLEHWNENGSLIDSYRSEEEDKFINDEMNNLNLCNSMESTFEPCKKAFSKNEYVKALVARGFTHSLSFEKWMETQI